MIEFFEFTKHHDNAGINSVFAGLLYMISVYLVPYVYGRKHHGLLRDDTNRMMLGFALMCTGLAVRIGFWIPWRSLLANSKFAEAETYRDYSWLWTWGGLMLTFTGGLMIMQPALGRVFGRWCWLVVSLAAIAFYGIGVVAAEFLARIFL